MDDAFDKTRDLFHRRFRDTSYFSSFSNGKDCYLNMKFYLHLDEKSSGHSIEYTESITLVKGLDLLRTINFSVKKNHVVHRS